MHHSEASAKEVQNDDVVAKKTDLGPPDPFCHALGISLDGNGCAIGRRRRDRGCAYAA